MKVVCRESSSANYRSWSNPSLPEIVLLLSIGPPAKVTSVESESNAGGGDTTSRLLVGSLPTK